MKKTVLLIILTLLSHLAIAATSDLEMMEHVAASACRALFTSTPESIFHNTPIHPGFFFWQDRSLKRELTNIRAIAPEKAQLVWPAVRPGDKNFLFASELGRREDGYVIVLLKDGTFKFEAFGGKLFHLGLKISNYIEVTARLLLDLAKSDRLNQVSLVVMTHTHPYVAAHELGKVPISNEFSDADIYSFNGIKAYFESYGFYFPLQIEIIFSNILEKDQFGDKEVAKKGLLYPETILPDDRLALDANPGTTRSLLNHFKQLKELSMPMTPQLRLERILSNK